MVVGGMGCNGVFLSLKMCVRMGLREMMLALRTRDCGEKSNIRRKC